MQRFWLPEIVLGFGLGVSATLFVAGAASSQRGIIGAVIQYVNDNEGVFVSLFTLALVVATMLLWLSTKELWKAGERQLAHLSDTSKQELRAYLYLKDANFKFLGEDKWKISYRIENFGRTPAHNVRTISVAKVVDWNEGKYESPVPTTEEAIGSMAPNGDYVNFEDKLVGAATEEEIKGGSKAIFLTGTILYDVAFAMDQRVTNFRFYIGGDVGCDGDEMWADSEGNDAT